MALLGILAVPGVTAPASPVSLPVLGVDPLVTGTTVENHQDAIPYWVEGKHTAAVLLHLDADHGLRVVSPKNLAALKGLAGNGDLPTLFSAGSGGAGRLYDAGNFVRVAAELGIVREVVWIVPFPIQTDEDAEKRLRDYLAGSGLSAQESGSFHLEEGCYRGRVGEITVRLCEQERLPAIRDPVLLSIGADFVMAAAEARGITPLVEIKALFTALRAARYAVLDAVVAFSILAGDLPPNLRWIGELVVRAGQDPSVVLADTPPERWTALQTLSTMSASGPQGEMAMLGYTLSQLERLPHDPAFLLYAAETADRHGGGEQALAFAEEACRMDRGYCVGLREVGLRFLERGDVETGLKFIAAGEKLLPGLEYGQLDLGIALMKVGKAAEALAALEKLRKRDGAYPSGFFMGLVHLHLGDRVAAKMSFDAALAAIEQSTDIRVLRGEIAQVIAAAAAYYREEGLTQQAERIEMDPRLRLPVPQPESGQTGGK